MDIIDSHAHIVREFYGDAQAEVIERAFLGNVRAIVNPAVKVDDIDELLALNERYPNIHPCIGLHPHDAKDWKEEDLERIEFYLKTHAEKIVAIGECGLDFYYNNSSPTVQEHVFRQQVRLARNFGKPVIVHVRDAWSQAIEILQSEGAATFGGVFHCFTGDTNVVEMAKKLDFYFSFSGILTFKKATEVQAAAKIVPDDRILVETDSPFLAPVPHRGKQNEPAYIWHVLEKLAGLREVSAEYLAKICVANTQKLFAIS